MDFKIPKFDELKDRLGIGEASSQAGSRSSRARDSRDDAVDYGDYGEYGFDDSADYAVENDSPSSSFTASLPKLVTSDDVRANIRRAKLPRPPMRRRQRVRTAISARFVKIRIALLA